MDGYCWVDGCEGSQVGGSRIVVQYRGLVEGWLLLEEGGYWWEVTYGCLLVG